MISYNDIQALIAEIDRVLPDRSGRIETPTENNGVEENAQQAVLEKVRWYLLGLRNQIEIEPGESSLRPGGQQETAIAIASAVMSQLNLHRQDWLQPLHGEVAELRRQRESLLAEIRTLEGRHLQLMSDFLQILLGRCSKALQQELSLALEKFETQLWQLQTPREEKVSPTPLQHLDRLQKLRSLQQQADVLVLNLDRTLRKVFESLEGDMQSYHQSLALGIAEMHELGQQGKTVLAAYLQRLNLELTGQSPGIEVTEESGTIDLEGDLVLEETLAETPVADTGDIEANPVASMAMFPFAGMEIPPAPLDREIPPGWELEEEGEIESVDALFEENIEERDEASEGLEAWEAWDEHLFHSDELMNADDEEAIPIVLTLKEAELEAEEDVSVEEPPVRDLFSGLADPAISAEEVIAEEVIAEEVIAEEVIAEEVIAEEVIAEEVIAEEVIAEEVIAEEVVSLDSPPPTIEAELFGEPPETEEEIEPVVIEENITSEATPPISETDSQTLDEIVGETIASLTELLEEKSEQVEEEEEIDDDEIISVAAGETLLATDEVKPQPQADLETLLDSGQLRTLTEDLANFEGNAPVSEVEISPADIEETLTEEEFEPPLEIKEAIATKEETVPTELSPTEETRASADCKPEIHLDSPEINAAMEVDNSFEEAFEEEIISEEDEDWMLPETAIAAVTEAPAQDAIAIPPSAILTSLADLDWQEVQTNNNLPLSQPTHPPASDPPPNPLPRGGEQEGERKKGNATNNQLEIVVDDDFELPPPKQVLAGAGTGRNSVPVMRSPKPTTTFSTREDLWDNSEPTAPPRDARNFSQNSKGMDNSDRAVTEIMTDPWSEAPEPSEEKRKQT
ncbi:MAG: hypothetical protein AAGA60_24505 [Cyanobacteria bacterium P01_E01_bin.42]